MQKYSFKDVETGIALLRNGSLDILIADTPILDYYRATDHGCKLQKIVESINEDTYAIGMNKGFPLKVYLNFLKIFLEMAKSDFLILSINRKAFQLSYRNTLIMDIWIY